MDDTGPHPDLALQQQLVAALRDPARYPHPAGTVRLLETHISWVLLAGRYAYKIKKAVDLGFLDFTSLAARRFYCEEEIRLNRRLAPQLYLEVVPIGGSAQQPLLGGGRPFEYAVRMRRFDVAQQADRLLARDRLLPEHIDRLAATVARFHAALPPADAASGHGTPQSIRAPTEANFQQLRTLLPAADLPALEALQSASAALYDNCRDAFAARRREGRVRECHGDLHLGNIVLRRGAPLPFDGIEFSAELRWIDVINEVAFLAMDLQHRQRADLAFRFLNGYLEHSGDYAGVAVLRYYLAYRAMVRAKIHAISARQQGGDAASLAACRGYLRQAAASLQPGRSALIITHGLPGCGKTTVAQAALERLQAFRLRSDIERKRLFGLAALERSGSAIAGGIYSRHATEQTYARLLALARGILQAGYPAIVDAAFLREAERAQFRALADGLQVPFVILSVEASPQTLRERISERLRRSDDASEADLAVLERLSASQQPLTADERACTLQVVNDNGAPALATQLECLSDIIH